MSVAIYLRSSSKTQSSWSQEPDLKAWAAGQSGKVTYYRDTFTGTVMDRPAFNRMMEGVQGGTIKTVVVWRLDRLGRTASGLTTLFQDFIGRGVNLISIKDGLDLSTPAGRMMANVLASVAQFETEVRRERQTAGIESAKERGVKFGRPAGPGKRTKVTPEQIEMVRRLAYEGQTKVAISKATGLSRPTVYGILQ